MRRDEYPLSPPPTKEHPHQRFQCGRGADQSPCQRGPNEAGRCPYESDGCHPKRIWSGYRRQAAFTAGLILAAVLVFSLGTEIAPKVIRPGDLTTPHAQIISGASISQDCAACHNNDLTKNWYSAFVSAHQTDWDNSMSDRCLKCHHGQLATGLELVAHNLPLATRTDLTSKKGGSDDVIQWVSRNIGPSMDQENLACATCHLEHRGGQANLSEMSDSQCQVCHVEQFDSFADSHPEFSDHFGGGGQTNLDAKIAFDHVRHAVVHYPKQATQNRSYDAFDCRSCHQVSGSIVTTLPYETACADCHDAALRAGTADGPVLVGLPTIPDIVAGRLESWPSTATGMPDGSIPLLTAALMRAAGSQSGATESDDLTALDYSRLDWKNPRVVERVLMETGQLRERAIDLAIGGQTRLELLLVEAGMNPEDARLVAASFPPILLRDAVLGWFGNSASEVSEPIGQAMTAEPGPVLPSSDLLLTDVDALSQDPLFLSGSEPHTLPTKNWKQQLNERMNASLVQSMGGWVRDDFTASISYRGTGHADPVLKAIAQWAAQRPANDPIRTQLLKQPAIAQCINCHRGAMQTAAVDSDNPWHANRTNSSIEQMTYFSHQPHLSIASLSNCQSCHRLQSLTSSSENAIQVEFSRIEKKDCVVCHAPSAAGDQCTKCHRYHVR